MPRELERLLLHPVVLGSLAVWAINDHYLKAALHNDLTGKLSDISSLVVAPVLGATATTLLGVARRRPQLLILTWALVMALIMATINTWLPAATAYRYGLAVLQLPFRWMTAMSYRPLVPVQLTMDPTDLWTIPAALMPVLLCRRGAESSPQRHRPRLRSSSAESEAAMGFASRESGRSLAQRVPIAGGEAPRR